MQKKKQTVQLVILTLAIAGTAMLLILLRRGAPPTGAPEVPVLAPVTVDTSVLSVPAFRELRVFGIFPVRAGKTGRENPFTRP